MLRERLIREEFLKSGQISHYEYLRQNKRGKSTPLLAAFHDVYKGKRAGDLNSHDRLLLSRFEYALKNNLPLFRLLRAICTQGAQNLLVHGDIRGGLINLAGHFAKCVRTPEAWRCPKGNFQVRFRHLIRHLYSKFPVPEFLENVWLENDPEAHKFYIDLGAGAAVYGHPYLAKAVMSRKTSHLFRQAPAKCSVVQAVRWAQLSSIRKDKRLFRSVAGSFLGKELDNDEFWSEGLRWLARQEGLEYERIRPLLRHINYRKYGFFQVGNVKMPLPAPDPDFNFSGRTFSSVWKDLVAFETTIKVNHEEDNAHWTPAPFPDFDWNSHPETQKQKPGFRMIQIVRYPDLVEEGIRQNHCVATYSNACRNGYSSIWSLRKLEEKDQVTLVTVELDNTNMRIAQVRRKSNQLATELEAKLVLEWAKQIGAEVPEYSLS